MDPGDEIRGSQALGLQGQPSRAQQVLYPGLQFQMIDRGPDDFVHRLPQVARHYGGIPASRHQEKRQEDRFGGLSPGLDLLPGLLESGLIDYPQVEGKIEALIDLGLQDLVIIGQPVSHQTGTFLLLYEQNDAVQIFCPPISLPGPDSGSPDKLSS